MKLEQSSKSYHASHALVYSCQYHVIWCPKYRRSVLHEPLASHLKELIEDKQSDYGDTVHDRDHNAAVNIHAEGGSSAGGDGVRPTVSAAD
jgi:hypothetical protein